MAYGLKASSCDPLMKTLYASSTYLLRRGFFSSSFSRLSKFSILVLLVICLHIFNLVSTKLNTVSVRIWPLHLSSLVPKNKRAIVCFLWLGLIFGMGCRAVSVQSIIWTGSKTNLNLFCFLIHPSALSTL